MKNKTKGLISEFLDLTRLSEREKSVLRYRLYDKTLKEIGILIKPQIEESPKRKQDGHLDTERIRQIEAKAVRKLKWYFRRV